MAAIQWTHRKRRRVGRLNGKQKQRSSSPSPTHFFKIILPSSMQHMKLGIPKKFVRDFGDELSTVAILTVPNGRAWHVGLEKANKNIWFNDGWQNFIEHYSIDYGYFLVFRYEGNSHFHTLIFDMTATEIQYPFNDHDKRSMNCKLEDQGDILEVDNMKKSRQGKLIKNEIGRSMNCKVEDQGDILEVDSRKKSRKGMFIKTEMPIPHELSAKYEEDSDMSEGRESAVEAARLFRPKNPSFMTILRPHNQYNGYVYVPAEFASSHLSGQHFVKLQASDGNQLWHAKCGFINRSRSNARTIGKGWSTFGRDNNLEEGDVCVFEVIKRKNIVLKVSMFRKVEYAGGEN